MGGGNAGVRHWWRDAGAGRFVRETLCRGLGEVAFLCLAPGAGCSSVLVHYLPVAWAGPGVEEKLTVCWSYFIREDRSSLPPNPRPVLEPGDRTLCRVESLTVQQVLELPRLFQCFVLR